MPIPKSIATLNKHFINRIILLFAGWIPPLAVIEHHGRVSGSSYRTPIMAFPSDGTCIFALTYGRDVDWVKNLRYHNWGIMKYNGASYPIYSFSLVLCQEVQNVFPFFVKLFLRILSVEDCLIAVRIPVRAQRDDNKNIKRTC